MSTSIIISSSEMTDDQLAALKKAAGGASMSNIDLELFMAVSNRTGLDPFKGQLWWINGRACASIDGLRALAVRSGKYAGQTEPLYLTSSGQWVDAWVDSTPPVACKIGVYVHGFVAPVYATCMWAEFGKASGKWKEMPAHMLAIRTESHALRKAFPNELSGIYTPEDMEGEPVQAHVVRPQQQLALATARVMFTTWMNEAKEAKRVTEEQIERARKGYTEAKTAEDLDALKQQIEEEITFDQSHNG